MADTTSRPRKAGASGRCTEAQLPVLPRRLFKWLLAILRRARTVSS
jgi:hypothetical protein